MLVTDIPRRNRGFLGKVARWAIAGCNLRIMRDQGTRIGPWNIFEKAVLRVSSDLLRHLLPMSVLIIASIIIAQRANVYMPLTWNSGTGQT